MLGTEGFGIISPDVAPGFSEAYHAVADLIAKCSYSFVGWYTRQVVLARILDRRRAAKESSADGATPRAGGAAGSGLGDVSVPGMAIKGLESAPTSARDAIMRIARALRAFGPGAAIVKHAVAGACDAAAAGVAAAAPAIAKSLLEAAKRASRRRVVRVLLVDPDPLVHTAVCARLRSLAAADVSTGIGANSAVAAASLLRPIDAAVGPTPADPDRSRAGPAAPSSAPRTPALEAMAQAAGLPGIEVVVESVFRLDDVPLVFARGDEHFDCVIATAATLRDLSALDPAEAHKRSLRLFGSASLRDHLTALTLARGRAAASLAAAAGPRTGRSSSARRATQDASHPDFQGALGSGASGARLLREEARRLRTEEPLGLAIKTREVFVSSPPPSLQPAADAPAGAAEQAAPKPAVVGRSSTPDRTAAERRMSLTEAASGAVAAADVRRMMLTKAAGVSPSRPGLTGAAAALQHAAAAGPAPASARSTSARHQRLTELSSAAGPSGAVRGDLTSGASIVRETHVHPTQRLFGLVPVVAVASDEETVASSGGADPAQALRRELGADLVVSGLDDAAQWRDVLGQVAREAAARGQAQIVQTPAAPRRRGGSPFGKNLLHVRTGVEGTDDEPASGGDDQSEASRRFRRPGRSQSQHSRPSRRTGGRARSRPTAGGRNRGSAAPAHEHEVLPATPAAVESMLALLRPAESVAAAREAAVRRYAAAAKALARAMAAGAVSTAATTAARAALAGSLSASGMAYLYRDRSAAERRLPGLRGPADEQQGTAAALPQLAIVLGQEAADDLTLVPTDAVEWRRHARSHSRNRSRRTADGDDSGHLSTNSHGRLIQRRDSAVMAMKGAFFGDSAQPDDADELWAQGERPRRPASREQPLPRPAAPVAVDVHPQTPYSTAKPAARRSPDGAPAHDQPSPAEVMSNNPMRSPPPPSYPGSPAVHTGQDDAAGSVPSASASRTTSADRKSVPSRTHGSAIVRDRGLGRYNRARRA